MTDLVPLMAMSHNMQGVVNATVKDVPGGKQAVIRFANGYGASVINREESYGTELAVVRFFGPALHHWHITYNTPITNDVVGWISNSEELLDILARIRDLVSPS